MSDIETLLSNMRRCALCSDLPLGPRPIFQLDHRTRVLVVGQAPGRITHAKGRPFEGDWVGWVGTWQDLVEGNEGQYFVRLKDNKKGYDTTYPGVEILPDGNFVVTTYGHWEEGEQPYILSVRFKLEELDQEVGQ